jgi:hypothetical protein
MPTIIMFRTKTFTSIEKKKIKTPVKRDFFLIKLYWLKIPFRNILIRFFFLSEIYVFKSKYDIHLWVKDDDL